MKKYLKLFTIIFILFSLIAFYFVNKKPLNASATINKTLISHNYEVTEDNPYIKNSIIPKYLYVISEDNMTSEEKTMIATLQGIVATKSEKQIYIISSSEPDYKVWLQDLKENYHVKYKIIKNPWNLLNKFKSYISGYILYSNLNKDSINNACTLASLEDAICIEESLESQVKDYRITNLIKDCRTTDKYWAYKNLWNSGLNHSTVIELNPKNPIALRDYAIVSKSLIFYEDDTDDFSLREAIFKSMDKNSNCLGWGPDEFFNVSVASKYGANLVAADFSYNLSVLSSYPSTTILKQSKETIENEDNVHYVTIIMSDGDNQQWLLGTNFGSAKWFGSPLRGNFNLGWSLSPSLYYLAPTVFKEYYKNASYTKFHDNFVVPPSGNGYIYPSKFPFNKLNSYTNLLNSYMKKVDQDYVIVLDDNAFYRNDIWSKYTEKEHIKGLFYLDYKKHNAHNGEILWSNNKPLVSCSELLWDNIEDDDALVKNIHDKVKNGYTNTKSSEAYSFVYVHVWSKDLTNVQYVVNKLNENPQVRIVTPNTFMELIKENLGK